MNQQMCFKSLATLFSMRILRKQPVSVRKSLKIISRYQKLTNSSLSLKLNGWRPPDAKY